MPIDPALRHQIEQDVLTAAWVAERLAVCDDAIALLHEIADLEPDDDGVLILGVDEHGHNDLMSRIKSFLVDHDQQEETTMTKLTETQSLILTAGTQRPDNLAMPLPKGLAGAAAKMAVTKMIERGWLQEADANLRRGEPLWRETGDGHGTTLVVTDAGLAAIGVWPDAAHTAPTGATEASGEETAPDTATETEPAPKMRTPREGTKQSTLIAMLRARTAQTSRRSCQPRAGSPTLCAARCRARWARSWG